MGCLVNGDGFMAKDAFLNYFAAGVGTVMRAAISSKLQT
jgi:hypothetical protein